MHVKVHWTTICILWFVHGALVFVFLFVFVFEFVFVFCARCICVIVVKLLTTFCGYNLVAALSTGGAATNLGRVKENGNRDVCICIFVLLYFLYF